MERHRRPAIGVDGELPAVDALAGARLADERLGQRRTLAMRDHPADDVPAEHVEHDVQVEVGPLRRAEQLGGVPAPQLVGPPSQQFGGRVARVAKLIASLPDLLMLGEQPIHGPLGAEIPALIEEGRVDFGWGEIHKA